MVVFDNASAADSGGALQSSLTFSHTVGTQENRFLLVGISINRDSGAREASSVTFAGQNLTFQSAVDDLTDCMAEWWYLVNPPTGAGDVVITLNGTTRFVGTAASFSGVNPSNPFGSRHAASTGGTDFVVGVNVTTNIGGLAFDVVSRKNSNNTPAPEASQTQRCLDVTTNSTAGNNVYGGISTEPTKETSTPMSWEWSGTARAAVILGCSLFPATSPPFVSLTGCGS